MTFHEIFDARTTGIVVVPHNTLAEQISEATGASSDDVRSKLFIGVLRAKFVPTFAVDANYALATWGQVWNLVRCDYLGDSDNALGFWAVTGVVVPA